MPFIPALRFNILTPFFDAVCNLFGIGKRYRQKVIGILQPKKGAHILDAGCGTGSLALEVKQQYPDCSLTGVDADSSILARARKKAAERQASIEFRQAFLQKLPFATSSFDCVYSSLVFHHLTTTAKKSAMKEIFRVLKPQGTFLLADFGVPKTAFSLMSWFTILLEEGKDNYQGKLPLFLKEAGFRNIKAVGRYGSAIVFLNTGK